MQESDDSEATQDSQIPWPKNEGGMYSMLLDFTERKERRERRIGELRKDIQEAGQENDVVLSPNLVLED